MGGQRSLERSVEEGLVSHIPVNKQVYTYAANDVKESTQYLMKFMRENITLGDSEANQRSRSLRHDEVFMSPSKYAETMRQKQEADKSATLPQQTINDPFGVYQYNGKSPFALYPDPKNKQDINANPPVSNYLSQTHTGFRMQDSQTFVKYPFKPAKKMYYGHDFRNYMGSSLELGDPDIVKHEIKLLSKSRSNFTLTPATQQKNLNYDQFSVKILKQRRSSVGVIAALNLESQSKYDMKSLKSISKMSQGDQQDQKSNMSPIKKSLQIAKHLNGGAKLLTTNNQDVSLSNKQVSQHFLELSKNGRYNYPQIKDSKQLDEQEQVVVNQNFRIVKQLQDTLGKDVVSKKVIINKNNLRKTSSNFKLPSINSQL
ncbi:UNKNOWN [Stylonychia lemnae]|uniref:Uncharacterized protein n=1 Tax=Stylonychia lemnae TaxID=5949 RepID=A0A078B1T2_STYLE|nr:UNKNOWN [Stylonychia lemnae]|eukprot:CDW88256.1 UNKNOWN [Stylonychia lemnae]